MIDKYGRESCTCGYVPPTHTHADDCPFYQQLVRETLPVKSDGSRVRYWDHNFNEVFPPDNFDHVTVDQADVRWHCRVMERFKLKNGGKSDD